MFPVAVRRSLSRISRYSNGARRAMGSDMPVPQSQKAVLFQGHPTNEGWEFTIAWWYTTSAVLLVGILGFAPQTEISVWARQEAEARLQLKEEGFDNFVFGNHYQKKGPNNKDTP